MKFTDRIIEKYGTDKILHFLVGAWIVSLMSFISLWCGIGCEALVAILSYIKEYKLDKFPDNSDILAGIIGGGVSIIVSILFALIF